MITSFVLGGLTLFTMTCEKPKKLKPVPGIISSLEPCEIYDRIEIVDGKGKRHVYTPEQVRDAMIKALGEK